MKTNQWIRPLFVTLLVLVGPLVGYYVYYVESREAFLLDRLYAHLANISARTEARFASAFDVIEYNSGRANDLGVGNCQETPRDQPKGSPLLEQVARADGGQLTLFGKDCVALVETTALIGDVDSERQFYDIVILDEKGAVVFQRDDANGRIADGQLLRTSAAGGSDSKSVAVSDPLGEMRTIYRGQPFLVFIQPLQVPNSGDKAWQIAGILEESRFNSLKYGIASGGVALALLVVLSVLLIGPFLKLWHLGRFEPLSRLDLLLQTGAGLSLVAMVTVTLLAWNTSARLSAYFDARLMSLAGDLRSAVREEFAVAAATLAGLEPLMIQAYEARSARNPVQSGAVVAGCPTIAGTYEGSPPFVSESGSPTVGGDVLMRLPAITERYRQLIMAYLMDEAGCQVVKWSSAANWTRPGLFRDREYFQRAVPNARVPLNLYRLDAYELSVPFYQDVVISRTTGDREIVFSKPVEEPNRSACAEAARRLQLREMLPSPAGASPGESREGGGQRPLPCVSVLTAKLRALESILPSGYSAMLVDRDSNIVLRDSRDATTEINLATEIDVPDSLRMIVRLDESAASQSMMMLDADYRRAPHRFFVVPLGVGGLSLVALYNRGLIVTTVLESVGAAAAGWALWIAVLAVLALLFRVADDMTERMLRHSSMVVGLSLVALLAFAWFALGVPHELLMAGGGIVVLLSLLPFLAREEGTPVNINARRPLIVLVIWLSVMLAAAFPMFHFYGDAEQRTLSALVRFSAQEYNAAEASQKGVFEAWKHKVGLGGDDGWVGFAAWKNQGMLRPEVAAKWSYPASPSVPPDCDLVDAVCLILRHLPDYHSGVAGIHSMYRAPDYGLAALQELRNELFRERFGGQELRMVAFGMFLVLTAAAIWYLLVRTLGLRAEDTAKLDSFVAPGANHAARYMVYGAPPGEKRYRYFEALAANCKVWVDLRDAPMESLDIPTSADVVALDEFDSNLSDIEVVRARVALLERLLREERRVIVLFVGTDPLNFVGASHDAEEAKGLLTRFAAALARFSLTYHEPPTEADRQSRPRLSVWKQVLAALGAGFGDSTESPGWRRKLVADECRHPELRTIRDDLLKQVDVRKLTKAQIVQQVHNRANAIYQQMWSRCTRVEKFTLIQLARGNPINPNNWDAARRLTVRGYVRADPFYRIASDSLRQFVVRMERTENVQSWREESPGGWDQIKVPLVVVLVGTLAFLALTQPNLFNSMFAFLAAGAASFPFIVNALSERLKRIAKGAGG